MSIALIIEKSNEEDTIKFVNPWSHIINQAKTIWATRTEKNKIETVVDKTRLKFDQSVDLQGLPNITAKVSRGEVVLVIYINPNTSNNESLPRLGELISACVKRNAHLVFTKETAEIVLQALDVQGTLKEAAATTHVREASGAALSRQPSMAVQQLLNRSMTTVAENERKQAGWSRQQMLYWLEANDLAELKVLFENDGTAPSNSMFDKHETKVNTVVVRSGKPEQLFDVLVTTSEAPLREIMEFDEFVRDWFMTFHSFLSPREFLRLLRKKYESADDHESPAQVVESVLNTLQMWIELERGADFYEDPELTRDFNNFMDIVSKKDPTKAQELKDTLSYAIKLLNNPPEPDLRNAPQPIIPRRKGGPPNAPFTVSDIDPVELARQLTLMESNLFRKVRAKEFHGTAWTKKNAEELAPNLTKVINLSNHISNWMVTELLKLRTVEEMTELIIKFIKTGKQMLTMYNFSGVMEVVTALNNSAVNKLKAAWAAVPSKIKEILEELMHVTSPLGHYKNYRAAFNSRRPEDPCLPILAASLSDLNAIEEVFSNRMPDNSVNWKKMSKVANRIWETVGINCVYPIRPVPEICNYIQSSTVWSDALTTCAIADLRMAEIAKMNDKREESKKSKRRSTSTMSLMVDTADDKRDELSERDWQILLTGAQPKKYKPGQAILKAGSANEHLYRIRSGTVRVVKEIDGQEVTIATMGENAMFGEVSMLLRSQKEGATASIIADTEVEIYALQIELVLQILETKPHLAEKLNRILAIKLARRLRDLGSKKPAPVSSKKSSDDLHKKKVKKDKDDSKKEEHDEEKKKEQSEKEDSPDAKFQKKFKLESSEVIIREFECSFKGNMTMHGSLFVSPNYLCADFGVFGFKFREALPFTTIQDIKKSKKKDMDIITNEGKTFTFTNFVDRDETFNFLKTIWQHTSSAAAPQPKPELKKKRSTKRDSPITSGEGNNAADASDRYNWLPSEEDWQLILKGARSVTYKKDDVVIREGEQFRRVFQLARGECRFEKVIDGKTRVLGTMVAKKDQNDNLFGEISFLEGGRASASVVCDKDDTQIYIIEGYFLDVLFEYYPDLPGRFYHYLAHVLSKRLKQRENAANAPAPAPSASKTEKSGKKKARKTREASTGAREKKDKDKASESAKDSDDEE